MAKVEAQDIRSHHTYSDGMRVFKVRKTVAVGQTYTQVVTTGGGLMILRNDVKVYDRHSDVVSK